MTPRECAVDLPAGRFRYLEWDGREPAVLLLHGLAMVADVWGPLARRLGESRPRLLALDQRGHGGSHPAERRYDIRAFLGDALAFMDELRLDRPHLVGHSMGARVAMVLAARHRPLVRSVAMVDIGPEAWAGNWRSTAESFEQMPQRFDSEADALAFASRGREMPSEAREMFLARLETDPRGGLRWRADTNALIETVRLHRSRNFWRDWERIRPPALLVRGARSDELRRFVYERMQRRNPGVRCVEIENVGHNIPLRAPDELARILEQSWAGEALV